MPVTPYFKDLHIEKNYLSSELNFQKFIVFPLFNQLEILIDKLEDRPLLNNEEEEGCYVSLIVSDKANNNVFYNISEIIK